MKNLLWYMVFGLLMVLEIAVLLASLTVAVLPIVMALTRHGFWWFVLWLLVAVLVPAFVWLDNAIEDL